MTYKEKLVYLFKRLDSIKCDECRDAAVLVESAIQNGSEYPKPDEEIALYHPVWGCITRALDMPENMSKEEQLMLGAMEAEMSGHVLSARQAKGELVYRIETAATTSDSDGNRSGLAPMTLLLIMCFGVSISMVALNPTNMWAGLTVVGSFLAIGLSLVVTLRQKK